LTALLLAVVLGTVPVAGCGEDPQTADQFCAEHDGVHRESVEPDGDATCDDGTEFEADGDDEGSSSTKKRKKRR